MENRDKKESEDTEKKSTIAMPCGNIGRELFESIFYEGRPAFLTYDGSNFKIAPQIIIDEDKVAIPLSKDMLPYKPYTFTEEEIEKINKLTTFPLNKVYGWIYREFDIFCDIGEKYKNLLTTFCFQTYQQHKLMTTAYLFPYGDPGSGKTRILELLHGLSYRAMLASDLNEANIYSFLGYHEEGQGTLLEDEAQTLDQNPEKMQVYRTGYRKGAVVPRIEFRKSGERIQRYYRTYCCKAFAGYNLPYDAALRDRCIPIHTIQGKPTKDELTEEDLKRFNNLKKFLLIWRLMSYHEKLPEVDTDLTGRFKEIWKPLLQISSMLPCNDDIRSLANEMLEDKDDRLKESPQAYVVLAAVKESSQYGKKEITCDMLWMRLKELLNGKLRGRKENMMETTQFGDISKHQVGTILGSTLGIKSKVVKIAGEPERIYKLEVEKLIKAAEKYKLPEEEVTKLRSYGQNLAP